MFLPMISRQLIVIAMLAVLTVGASLADDAWVVREDGVGPVMVGMTLSQLNGVLNEKFSLPHDKGDQGCFYVKPAKHPHVSFMVEDGHLTRIDIDRAGIPTVEGIQVGDSEAHALQVYGRRLKTEPHKFTVGHYLTARSADGRYGIRFETEKGKIQNFYAGRFGSVQYVEGCQ